MSNQNQTQQPSNPFDIAESSYKTTHTAVRKARRFALQGLYEWLMTDYRFEQTGQESWKTNAPHDIAARTRATNAMHTVHLSYYHDLMGDIPAQIDALEALISQHLDRAINMLDPIERAILLIGTYELKDRLEVPYKVVLDEAMKLNTHFGATDAHKLINAVLDKLAPLLRKAEVVADQSAAKQANKTSTSTTEAIDAPIVNIKPNDDKPNENSKQTTTPTPLDDTSSTSDSTSKPRIGLKSTNEGAPSKRNATNLSAQAFVGLKESHSLKQPPTPAETAKLKKQLANKAYRVQSSPSDPMPDAKSKSILDD